MKQIRIPAVFMRGGTSRALMLKIDDLPKDQAKWPALFRAMLGSPDPNGRQLDGMGGGISSLSKICIIGPSDRDDADIDYTFAQVSVTGETVDFSGNCGNMSSAVGPFAIDSGVIAMPDDGECTVRIFNTNTSKIIHSTFMVEDGEAAVSGDMSIPGVAGGGAPVRLDFFRPAGTQGRGLLPSGEAQTKLELSDGSVVSASLIDAGVPAVFVLPDALGIGAAIMDHDLESDPETMARLEEIRCAGSVAMGIASGREQAGEIIAIPKVAIVAPAQNYRDLSKQPVESGRHALTIRMISAGQPHKAVPITGALAVACGAAVPGSIIADLIAASDCDVARLPIGTPSGVVTVGTALDAQSDASSAVPEVERAFLYRTQRRLMEGVVCVPSAIEV
ncbi:MULTISPECIES: PrpF domain-containing protein [Thalassospira]|uniref:PrpF family protein n=2 Tax=Thalassospira TaxID=168934 RepID=A0A367W200_9PROT|nr:MULTISPECIES: PrpF domain-containing protein [Thalassospira]MDG4720335.1 PrpF domain-containing protein [Thalassospira sp. FZY0004]RCK32172.1 PrpF family protein [Thalassospira profundimaris]